MLLAARGPTVDPQHLHDLGMVRNANPQTFHLDLLDLQAIHTCMFVLLYTTSINYLINYLNLKKKILTLGEAGRE